LSLDDCLAIAREQNPVLTGSREKVQEMVADYQAAMAVLVQELVPSRVSGLMHTLDISGEESDCLVIYASWGLGCTVVEGRGQVDRFVVERDYPHRIRRQEITVKETLVRPQSGGGEEVEAVSPEAQEAATLSEDQIHQLVSWALTLERYFKRPQEVEWAVGQSGQCFILQSRGLVFSKVVTPPKQDICESCAQYPVLVRDTGVVAHAGVGAGVVAQVSSELDMNRFPEGAVLVTKYTAPWLARIVPKAAAIIAERGSAAGHLATIAREFRVPTLVGVEAATEFLQKGMKITVDTKGRVIYDG
jgi:pyruvate,water dikinase